MNTHTRFARVFSWVLALVMVFSLAAIPAAAEEGTYSAELILSSEGFDVSGKLVLNTVNPTLALIGSMSSQGQTILDASAYSSLDAVVLESTLIGGALGLDLNKLIDNLPSSIFAPDSGSSYAMSPQAYERLMAFLQNGPSLPQPTQTQDVSGLTDAVAVLTEAFTEPLTQVFAQLVIEQEAVVETINGTDVDATRITVSADSNVVLSLMETVISTTQSSVEVQDALLQVLDFTAASGLRMEPSSAEMVRTVVENGDQLLEEARASMEGSDLLISFSISLSNTTLNPVKSSLCISHRDAHMDINLLISEALDMLRMELVEDGQVGPAFQFDVREADDVRTFKFSLLNADVEESSVALELNDSNQTFLVSLFSNGQTFTTSGFYTAEEHLFTLTVDKVDGEPFGGTISVVLRNDDTVTLPDFTDVVTMSEEDLTAMVQQVQQTVQAFSQMLG